MRLSILLSVLPDKVAVAVKRAFSVGTEIDEIRLRENLPVMVTVAGKSLYLGQNGQTLYLPENRIICDSAMIKATLLNLCDNSVFSHTNELKEGFVALKGGFRAGVCGDFSGGTVPGVSSINIRIAREIIGCADEFADAFCGGMLIVGPPGCGKTTVLRDLIRSLSLSGRRVAVIDSRREISGGAGECVFDLGVNTDIIFTHDKARGVQMALRSMNPTVIAFDEVGTAEEIEGILEAFNSGVYIITTAHAGLLSDLAARPVTRALLESGTLKTVALMPQAVGGKTRFYSVSEVLNALSN